MTEHTPGLWIVEEDEFSICYRIVASEDIAEAYWMDGKAGGIGEANARLIAAAPELLAVAEMAIDRPEWEPITIKERASIRAAIAKAKGHK